MLGETILVVGGTRRSVSWMREVNALFSSTSNKTGGVYRARGEVSKAQAFKRRTISYQLTGERGDRNLDKKKGALTDRKKSS